MARATFQYPGGKSKWADEIIGLMPDHRVYAEPFGGSGSILYNKPRSSVEAYNDANGDLVHFFKVMRERGDELQQWLKKVPYSREVYEDWGKEYFEGHRPDDDISKAGRFFYLRYANYCGIADHKAGFHSRSHRNMSAPFVNSVERLSDVTSRFRGVVIEHGDWSETVDLYDCSDGLLYFDPPYIANEQKYEYEDFDRQNVVETLPELESAWMLSCENIPKELSSFTCIDLDNKNRRLAASHGKTKTASEYLICSFDPDETSSFVNSTAKQNTITAYTER